jgi:(1->4)-alpha-D-glucan 1-alpha-D-glucosylmutase
MNDDSIAMATYRLQLNRHFRLEDARELVAYLSRLGVTHAYSSPILRARSGSGHGYDVVDPKTINRDLGDETDLRELVGALRTYGMGLILDIVPNHMAASSTENPYWQDVLMYGPCAPYAHWFDIDWRLAKPEMWGRVLVPVLGDRLSRILAQDQLCIAWRDGRLTLRYFEHVFPLDPATVPTVFRCGLDALRQRLADDHPAVRELCNVLDQLEALPSRATRLRSQVDLPIEQIQHWLSQLAQIVASSPQIQQWAEQTAGQFGEGEAGRDRLRRLLQAQNYRLVYWRRAATAINYRRFFDIDDLISLRQEDPQVFEETHALVRRWVDDGLIDGLRVDHVDGLRDPRRYVEWLDQLLADGDHAPYPRLIFVEKILAADEPLRSSWPVAGTTGYDFLNQVESVLISPQGFAEIEMDYRRLLRRPVRFDQAAQRGKRRVLHHDLSAYVGRLADILVRLAQEHTQAQQPVPQADSAVEDVPWSEHPETSDIGPATSTASRPVRPEIARLTKQQLADAIAEVTVALPVYRTYIDQHAELHPDDRRYLETAITAARNQFRVTPEALDFLEEVLLLERYDELPEHIRRQRLNFVQRFQQLTGPAAAKGIEDTALYAYVPLVSRNEVGGAPDTPLDDAVAVLHAANGRRAASYPYDMLCATTHDTKRTADVRARLDVLSEVPRLWNGYVSRWRRRNRVHRSRIRGKAAPDAAAEYLFYQTAVGIWPAPDPDRPEPQLPDAETLDQLRTRIEQYMLKAVREAKTRTNWVQGDPEFEAALTSFIRGCFQPADDGSHSFLGDVDALVARIARPGFWNSLTQILLRFCSPGTPDLYQGDELWNFALVDPDNRQAVDYPLRQCLLDEMIQEMEASPQTSREFVRKLVAAPEDGRVKLLVTHALLRARRDHPQLFAAGSYEPLDIAGPCREHLIGFARVRGNQAAIAVAPRLTTGLVDDLIQAPVGAAAWPADNTIRLPETLHGFAWENLMTRDQLPREATDPAAGLPVARVLEVLPVALLIGRGQDT